MGSSVELSKDWESIAQISRDVLRDSIPKQWLLDPELLPTDERTNVSQFLDECGVLSAEELEMTKQHVNGLQQRYKTGAWTAESVVIAFLKRATVGNQILNFATEFLSESALETARTLDAYFKTTGQLFGPLHGVPVSVKEHVAIGGRICHASFISKISNVALEDAHVVKLLKQAGAIVHVRTNQPQSIMHLDCSNNITGMTLNPLHRRLSPGGSSGGEGAAVGSRCSVLGVGTDIGGSIRAPASFCNVYGFKPTALRNPSLGLVGVMGGQESIRGCVGPLAQSVEDLVSFQTAVLDQEPWNTETALVPLPWRREKQLTKSTMTVGILLDDGIVRPHPPMTRAIKHVSERLEQAGIRTVPFEPLDHARGWEILRHLYFADGGQRLLAALEASGEPMLPLTQHALSFPREQGPLSIPENWDYNFQREKYRREYHALMKQRGVDVILCPSYVGAGVIQGQAKYWLYTAIWNILDQPAVSLPSGVRVDSNIDTSDIVGYSPRSEEDKRECETYDPDLFHGLPISVQLVGKHHRDEELMEAASIIEAVLGIKTDS